MSDADCPVSPLSSDMTSKPSIFLIGMMGAGKSTVGRLLAKSLNRPFVDTDHELESRSGVRINTIFALEGEAGFRTRETALLDELTQRPGIVLSTGGGVVLSPVNREYLETRGRVVYLRATVNTLWQRTRFDRQRPLLQTSDPRATLEALHTERDPLYREIAQVVIETGQRPLRRIVETLLLALADQQEARPERALALPPEASSDT